MQAHEGMDALVFNLRQEHVVICDFVSTFHQVCLPPLIATESILSCCAVQSHSHLTKLWAGREGVCSSHRGPTSLVMLGQACRCPQTSSGLCAVQLSRALLNMSSAGSGLTAHSCALADIDPNPKRALHCEQLTQLPGHCGVCAVDCCAQRGPGC